MAVRELVPTVRMLVTTSLLLVACATGSAADFVPFVLPWDDGAPGPTNISNTLDKPAGSFGFVQVENGHLYTGHRRLRIFGTNVTAAANFPDHDTADKIAARMAKFGFNAV